MTVKNRLLISLTVVLIFAVLLGVIGCQRVAVYNVALNETYLELRIGDTETLVATVDTDIPATVTWTSSHTNVATVEDGVVTAVGAGTASIKASVQGKVAVCTVAVLPEQVSVPTSVILSQNELVLQPNSQAQLTAMVLPNLPDSNHTVTWKSFDTSVATVTGNGLVKGIKVGSTTVIAYSGDVFATCDIIVTNSPTASIDGYEFRFKTFTVDGSNVKGSVSNDTEEFYFENEIVAGRGVSYVVCKDIECTDAIPSKVVNLVEGDNVFYILATLGNVSRFYKVTINRIPLYTLTTQAQGRDNAQLASSKQRLEFGENAIVSVDKPTLGYDFLGWYDGDELLFSERNYSFSMPARNLTLTAKFQIDDAVANLEYKSTDTMFYISGVKDTTITEVTVPEYATTLYTSAFDECADLQTLNWLAVDCTTYGVVKSPFAKCNLTEVNVGGKVKKFKSSLFEGCSKIQKVDYDGDIAEWCAISMLDLSANPLRYAKTFYLQGESAYNIDLPANLKMGSFSFGNVPFGTVNYLGDIESWCKMLLNSYNSPATYAEKFSINGEELTHLVIPQSVTEIGWYTFAGIKSLTRVTFHNKVKSVGDCAFMDCINLNRVDVPDITSWLNIKFGLNYITSNPLTYAKNLYVDGELLTELVVPDGITEIGQYAFASCSITSVKLPASVKTIGKCAFDSCGVTAFDCNKVTRIENAAFRQSSLTTCDLGDVTYIGDQAFYGSTNLTTCDLSKVTYIGNHAFDNTKLSGDLVIPNSVTHIGERAFNNCKNITSLTIGGGVETMGKGAFCNTGIASLTIAEGVTEIGGSAFYACSNLTFVELPASIVNIGTYSFGLCRKLEKLVISDGVEKIEENAFISSSIMDIYYKGTQDKWEQIEIENRDATLEGHTVRFYSQTEPELNAEGTAYVGNYWHYVDGAVTAWRKEGAI